MKLLFFFCISAVLVSGVPSYHNIDPDYSEFLIQNQLIYEHIFRNYQKDVAPVHTEFNESATALEYLNAGGSSFTIGSSPTGIQCRLERRPSCLGSGKFFRYQLYLCSKKSNLDSRLHSKKQITYFGQVSSFYNLVVRQPCTLKLEKFPFDTQTCMFWIYSNSAGVEELFAEHKIVNGLDVSTWSNGEWNVLNVSVHDIIAYEGDRENEMQVGEYSIVIKRTTAYYVTIILIPCFLSTLIIIVGLFMANPEELMGKLTIGLTGIMALVFLMGLANSLPRTATLPNMTIYILTCLSLIVNSAFYVLVFPDDPFTKKIVPERVLAAKDKLEK